jgi:predicted phosphodiesterase
MHLQADIRPRNRAWTVLVAFLLLVPQLQGAWAASLSRGPYLQMRSDTGITVRWRTDVPTPSELWWGTSVDALDQRLFDPTLKSDHALRIEDLSPDTPYWYAVGDGSALLAGGDATTWLRTAPVRGEPRALRIWVIGDSGLPGPDQVAVRDAYLGATGSRETDFVLLLGDNAYPDGTDAQYQAGLFDPYAALLRTTPLWPARGNHDSSHPGSDDDYFDYFDFPTNGELGGVASGTESWFSFDVGNVHFICLDSYQGDLTPPSAMLDWVEQDLAANSSEWTIVFTHYPPYTKGSHDSDTDWACIRVRENFVPLFEVGGVDLVLSGHSHSFERSYLIDGHYGDTSTFDVTHLLDGGDGDRMGDGVYRKPSHGPAPHEGTVYAVVGCSSRLGPGTFDHPAMLRGSSTLGSMILEVDADGLSARFLDGSGSLLDAFTITKGQVVATPPSSTPWTLRIEPNPFAQQTRLSFELPRSARLRAEIFDVAGRWVRTIADGSWPSGPTVLHWDGRDGRGRSVAGGSYFLRLWMDGSVRASRKLVLLR